MGQVSLTKQEYDAMHEMLVQLEQSITIEKNYWDKPVVRIDLRFVMPIIERKFAESKYSPEDWKISEDTADRKATSYDTFFEQIEKPNEEVKEDE